MFEDNVRMPSASPKYDMCPGFRGDTTGQTPSINWCTGCPKRLEGCSPEHLALQRNQGLFPGSEIKAKIGGMKRPLSILTYNETITPECYYQDVLGSGLGGSEGYSDLVKLIIVPGPWTRCNENGQRVCDTVGKVFVKLKGNKASYW